MYYINNIRRVHVAVAQLQSSADWARSQAIDWRLAYIYIKVFRCIYVRAYYSPTDGIIYIKIRRDVCT